jgi:hypothetical protein
VELPVIGGEASVNDGEKTRVVHDEKSAEIRNGVPKKGEDGTRRRSVWGATADPSESGTVTHERAGRGERLGPDDGRRLPSPAVTGSPTTP